MSEPIFPEFDFETADPVLQDLATDIMNIKQSAIKQAIKDKYTQYYKRLIDEEQYQFLPSYCAPDLRKLHKLKTTVDNITDVKQGSNPYAFYTVNFRPEYDDKIEEIDDVMKDFTQKCKYLSEQKYAYTIEQRSEDDDTKGIHCHIIFEKGKNPPSKLQRAFKNKFFDKYVGTNACLDYKYISEDKFKDKLEYIMGIKQKDKMAKVHQDRRLRKQKGIGQYYTNGYEDQCKKIITEHNLEEVYI